MYGKKFDLEKYESELKYIKYFKSNVFYLPQMTPEDVVYDQKHLEQLMAALPVCNFSETDLLTKKKRKEVYYKLVELEIGEKPNVNQYYAFFERLANYWVKENSQSDNYKNILRNLKEIQDKCENE